MKILALAAVSAIAAAMTALPASAEVGSFRPHNRVLVGNPAGTFRSHDGFRRDCTRGECRRFDRDGRSDVVMDWYGGEWAMYNNRSWDSDSYNDWWNDRPDRAYPAWMRHNEGCQRMWFAGDTLRC